MLRFVGDCRYHMGSPLTPEEVRRWGGRRVSDKGCAGGGV